MALPRSHANRNLRSCDAFIAGLTLVCTVAAQSPAHAQSISPRTIPVQMGQQFDIIPSDRAGMAGVSIALDDALLDPFVNPAKSVRLKTGLVSIAPYFHNQSDNRGSGRTLPLSGVASVGKWSFGGLYAMQQLDRPAHTFNAPISERSASNQYAMVMAARSLGHGFAVGASAYIASLEAEQGVDQLYSGSDRILQSGSASDVRLGLTRAFGQGQNFELLALRSSFDMTHDVHWRALRSSHHRTRERPLPNARNTIAIAHSSGAPTPSTRDLSAATVGKWASSAPSTDSPTQRFRIIALMTFQPCRAIRDTPGRTTRGSACRARSITRRSDLM